MAGPKHMHKKTAPLRGSKKQRARKQKAPRQKRQPKHQPKKGGSSFQNKKQGVAQGSKTSTKQFMQNGMVLAGCDYISAIKVNGQTDPEVLQDSAVLADIALNPAEAIDGSRLEQFAQLWDKFEWEELQLLYVPSCPTTTAGTICLAGDPDVFDNYGDLSGDALITKLTAAKHNVSFPVWQETCLNIKDRAFFNKNLFMEPEVGSDPRNCYAGRLWAACIGPLVLGTYGRLYLKWRVKFIQPNIDPNSDTGGFAGCVTTTGTYVSSKYDLGDFTSINAQFDVGNPAVWAYQTGSVSLSSDATLGSVVTFNEIGTYFAMFTLVGTAIGTGSISNMIYKNCTTGFAPVGFTGNAVTNAGSTITTWFAPITVTKVPATMTSTGGAGTHSQSFFYVAKAPLPPTGTGIDINNFTMAGHVANDVVSLVMDKLTKLSLKGATTGSEHAQMARKLLVDPTLFGETSLTGIISQGDAPQQKFTLTGGSDYEANPIGTPVPVLLDGADAKPKKRLSMKLLEQQGYELDN